MIATKVKEFLDRYGIRYVTITHSPAYTAADIAASAHVAGRGFAKTIILRIDSAPAMMVLPANRRLLIHDIRELLDTSDVRLASEAELRSLFPDCEVGAMPPFGNLYGMKVYIVPPLAQEPEIAFNAGTHTEVIRMAYDDYNELVKPLLIDLVTT